jgi:hypothetical protein
VRAQVEELERLKWLQRFLSPQLAEAMFFARDESIQLVKVGVGPANASVRLEAPRLARTARRLIAGSGRNLIAGPIASLRVLKRGDGYPFFFPIPSHFLILSMSAIARLYARALVFAMAAPISPDVATGEARKDRFRDQPAWRAHARGRDLQSA